MSLLTVERSSPSPHESDTGENEDLLSTSSYDGFMAREHFAMCLSHRPMASMASLGPLKRGDQSRIFSHLRKLVKVLRPQDSLKLAVELENSFSRPVTKYLIIVTTNGYLDTEETIVLGTEQEGSTIRMCMVLPLWRDTEIKLDGDGGFSVHTGDRHQVFKPSSVQSMWTALQILYKATEHARMYNFYVGGLSHTWMPHYTSKLTDNGTILNEWNLLDDVESFRPDSPVYKGDTGSTNEERLHLEKLLVNKLRDIMLQMDLEEVTSKQLRMQLEQEVSMELSEYKGFLDQEMLRILGQMERPSEIFDYLYLGSEWNASNLQELKELGVRYILNVTREIDNFYPEEFKYLNIRLYDVPSSELLKHWDKTYAFIKEAKDLGKKVLVHCKMGISRSAATVTAFAMKEYRMSLKDALAYVKGRRSVVNPNDGFVAQLRDYEGILKARHNSFWGKMAPSRPLINCKFRSMSEPNLPECLRREQRSEHSAELDLPFVNEDNDSSHDNQTSVVPLQSFSQLPTQLMPVDKDKQIKNFLASLPSLQTIDDDQGIGENAYTSESGSGSSSPMLTPTDDETFNLRHKLAKEIKEEKNTRSRRHKRYIDVETESSPTDLSGGYYSQTSSSQVWLEKAPSLSQSSLSIPPKPSPPVTMRHTKSKVSPAPPFSSTTTTPMMAQLRQPIAQASQLPYRLICKPKASKATSVPHNLALAHNLSSFPPTKLSTISPQSSRTSLSSMVVPEVEESVDEGDLQAEESIMITVTDSKEQLVEDEANHVKELPTIPRFEHEGHTRQSSDGALPTLTASSSGCETIMTSESGNQHRRAKSDGDNVSGPTQIQSVPDRVKEIEEMHGVRSSNPGGSSHNNTAPSSGGLFMSISANSEDRQQSVSSASTSDDKQQSVGSASVSDDKQQSVGSASVSDDKQQSISSMSRTSSEHSLSSSSHDIELEEIAQYSSSCSPRCVRSTRHGSLSPNPHSLQMKMVTEQTRCTSLMYLPQNDQEQRQQQSELNDGNLASSLMGAVKARVQDIEEKNKDISVSAQSKCSPDKNEGSTKFTPPPTKSVERPLSSVVASSADEQGEDNESVEMVRRHSTNDQLSSSCDLLDKDVGEASLPNVSRPRMGRRESTPPALLSAWSQWVPADGIPTKPVQDLKQKFEDSTKESKLFSKSTEAPSQAQAFDNSKVGSNLKRSQSLKAVGSPMGNRSYRHKHKKPSCEEFPTTFTPVSDACSQD